MQNLITHFKLSYYAEPMLFVIAIIAFILSIKLKNHQKSLNSFRYYFGFFILLDVVVYNSFAFPNKINSLLETYTDYAFTIFEYWVFITILQKSLRTSFHKICAYTVKLIFFSTSVLLPLKDILYYQELRWDTLSLLFSIQAISLIFACVLFYINLFRMPANNLKNHPEFWIATGLSIFMISTFPYSLFVDYFYDKKYLQGIQMFIIFKLFYILLFIMIIRAYFCKPIISINSPELGGTEHESHYNLKTATHS